LAKIFLRFRFDHARFAQCNEVNRTVSSASLSRHMEDGLFLKLCKVRGEKPRRVCRERIIRMSAVCARLRFLSMTVRCG